MFKSTISSFIYAIEGIITVVKTERNMKIHLFMTSLVLSAAFMLNVTVEHLTTLLLCIGWVLMAEMFNTSLEVFCDSLSTEQNPKIKKVKDVAAGAVLISATFAAIIGVLLFYPYIQSYLTLIR